MVLEGVVFTAGQLALLDLLDDRLPGLQQGTELVLRDERWHVGFGARCLADLDYDEAAILDEGERAAALWAPEYAGRVMDGLRSRLRAVRRQKALLEGRGVELETEEIAGAEPALVFLHEGLGSVALWRDFPARLAAATGRRALIYSRAGHGFSDVPDATAHHASCTRRRSRCCPRSCAKWVSSGRCWSATATAARSRSSTRASTT